MPPCVCSARSAASKPASAHRYLAVLASRATGLAVVVQPGRLAQHQLGGVQAAPTSPPAGTGCPWFMPIGRPNTSRSLPYRTAARSAARPMPSASAAIRQRSGFRPSRM